MTVQQKPAAVTTGPVAGSRKIHSSPAGRPDIAVPFREIDLHPSAGEPAFRIYDTSGPYTDPAARIDLEAGLVPLRGPWLARRGLRPIAPRAVQPEDNGYVGDDRLVAECPAQREVLAGTAGLPVTQLEFARAGIVTEEMIYVAHRENLGRAQAAEVRRRGAPMARISAPPSPRSSPPNSSAPRLLPGAPSSRPTSTTRNWSRW